jgi:hypothetical protein
MSEFKGHRRAAWPYRRRTAYRWILLVFAARRVSLDIYPADVAEISGAKTKKSFDVNARRVNAVHEAAGRTCDGMVSHGRPR